MVAKLYSFITGCWSWMPNTFVSMIMIFIAIAFGDSLLGIIDRGWRILGR